MAEKLQSSLLFMTFIQHEPGVTTDMKNQTTKKADNDAMVKVTLACLVSITYPVTKSWVRN